MSAATTESLVRRYFDAFNRGDTDGMLTCVANGVVHDVNQGVRREGKEAFRAFCGRMSHCYREKLTGITVMVTADGRRAAAEYNVEGVYLETDDGMPDARLQIYGLPAGTFFAIDDGLITRITTYYNLTEWLVQVTSDIQPGGPARNPETA